MIQEYLSADALSARTGVTIDFINDLVARKVIPHRIVAGTVVFPYPEVIAAGPFPAPVDSVKNSSPATVEPVPAPATVFPDPEKRPESPHKRASRIKANKE